MRPRALAVAALAVTLLAPRPGIAQERGAVALAEAVHGLGVTARVLVIAAHPDDEDTELITWLSRGRYVETAYLSLTRGDGGQNLIGNELGEALGVIRTEELLAARRVDGARQYFTRAYDFGFSKSVEETLRHWPRDSVLQDVVTVVRAFRPHVIVAMFTGTPADGHGHHQLSGLLAREAFDAAADTARFPARRTAGLGAWAPAKFYRGRYRTPRDSATVFFNVGEYSHLLGRSYAEVAAESRSQHASQAFGQVQQRGPRQSWMRLEATRVPGQRVGEREQGIFDGVDTTWGRFASARVPRAIVDSLATAVDAARRVVRADDPRAALAAARQVLRAADAAERTISTGCRGIESPACTSSARDLSASLETVRRRAHVVALEAAGVSVEAFGPRRVLAVGDTATITHAVYNGGRFRVQITEASIGQAGLDDCTEALPTAPPSARCVTVLPDSVGLVRVTVRPDQATNPWWLAVPRVGDIFARTGRTDVVVPAGEDRAHGIGARVTVWIGDSFDQAVRVTDFIPILYRYADPTRGDVRHPVIVREAISVLLDGDVSYARAGVAYERTVGVRVSSALSRETRPTITLALPAGLVADSVSRTITLPARGATTVEFRVRGTLPVGAHEIRATAALDRQSFTAGYIPIEYDHIRPQQLARPAVLTLQAVDVRVPERLRVAYVPGVGDNVPPALRQLGITVDEIQPADLARADLSAYTTLVVGPRAFEANPDLAASAPKIHGFARRGGTVVMQYGQYEMTRGNILPHAITIARPHTRVAEEDARVRVLDPGSPLLATPNRIDDRDFTGWVQERALYMPAAADSAWRTLLSMNDTGERPNDAAILVAPLGQGVFVYTTLAFFRQLPAGHAGAARLFVNLLSADRTAGLRPAVPQAPSPVRP